MHPTATYYRLTGDRGDLQQCNLLSTSNSILDKVPVLAAKSLWLVDLAFVMQKHIENYFRKYQTA